MYCSKCGTKIDDANFCSKCGAPQGTAQKENIEQAPTPKAEPTDIYVTQPAAEQPAAVDPKPSTLKKQIGFGALLTLVILGAIAFNVYNAARRLLFMDMVPNDDVMVMPLESEPLGIFILIIFIALVLVLAYLIIKWVVEKLVTKPTVTQPAVKKQRIMARYVEKNLGMDEQVIYMAKIHSIYSLGLLLGIVLVLIGSGFIGVVISILSFILMRTTELGITNKRLIGKTGLFNTESIDYPLNKINITSVSSDFWGKMLRYGNIEIATSSGKRIVNGIVQPEKFRAILMNQINQYHEDQIKKQASELAQAMKS